MEPFDYGYPARIAVSPDGRRVALAMAAQTVLLADLQGQRLSRILNLPQPEQTHDLCTVAFSRSHLVTPDARNLIKVWKAEDGKFVGDLEGHTAKIRHLAAHEESDWLVSAAQDGTARIWDMLNLEPQHVLDHGATQVWCADFSPDGLLVATGSADGMAYLWDPGSGDLLHPLPGHSRLVRWLAFSPDSTRLVTASRDGTGRLWDTSTGRELAVMRGHTGPLREVIYSEDGSRIFTLAKDATVRVWDADGRLLATRVEYQEDGWLTFTPGGYYLAGGPAAEWAKVLVNGREYPLSSYAEILEDPDKVRQSLAGDPPDPPRVWPEAPTVSLIGELDDEQVHDRSVRLQGNVRDASGIDRVTVTVNGEPLEPEAVAAGLTLASDRRSAELNLVVEIPARTLSAALQVRARNRNGIWSEQETLFRHYAPTRGVLRILALGVQEYDDPGVPDLRSPLNDVRMLAERFQQEAGGLYRETLVHTLTNREVSVGSLNHELETFLYEANPEDTILVFVAGHGMRSGSDTYYFLTPDAPAAEPWRGIPRENLEKLVRWDRLKPERRLLLFDTCQAGQEVDGASRGFTMLDDVYKHGEVLSQLGSGVWVVAGSTEAGAALETATNGIFTAALLEGLQGAANRVENGGDGDEYIDIEELIDFAERKVSAEEGSQQRVQRTWVQSGTPFRLARDPGRLP